MIQKEKIQGTIQLLEEEKQPKACVYEYLCMCVHVCMNICIHMCVHVCMNIFVYVCMSVCS